MNYYIRWLALQVTLNIAYIVCVTKAAMYFNNPKILFWYLLLLLMGYSTGSGGGKQ